MSIFYSKNSDNKIKKHAHEVAFASILDVASKTSLFFGKTLVVCVIHAVRYVVSSGPYISILDSAENQISNFIGGL
ncbi:MAG: hypothetical protein D4R72_07765 [Nitrosopumilales archaeon]|nr:MAG: hypothetical protein D4R72_07765 [Nitrosopumilales archaeon]